VRNGRRGCCHQKSVTKEHKSAPANVSACLSLCLAGSGTSSVNEYLPKAALVCSKGHDINYLPAQNVCEINEFRIIFRLRATK
jgi:hypothetical protein